MRSPVVAALLIAGLLVLTTSVAFAQTKLPAPQGRVTDLAGILSESARQQALTRIRQVDDTTTAEIAVASVPSLDGTSIEEYANRLFHEWGIGNKERDNGILILVAPIERKVRIEVGYGLEPILPDGLTGEIIRRDVLPKFRSNDYEAGILAAVNRVAEIVEKNETVSPEERQRLVGAGRDPLNSRPMPIVMFGFFAVLGAIAIGSVALGLFLARRRNNWRLGTSNVRPRRSKRNWTMPVSDSSSSSSSAWSSSDSSSSSSSSSDSSSFGGGDSGGGGASGSWQGKGPISPVPACADRLARFRGSSARADRYLAAALRRP